MYSNSKSGQNTSRNQHEILNKNDRFSTLKEDCLVRTQNLNEMLQQSSLTNKGSYQGKFFANNRKAIKTANNLKGDLNKNQKKELVEFLASNTMLARRHNNDNPMFQTPEHTSRAFASIRKYDKSPQNNLILNRKNFNSIDRNSECTVKFSKSGLNDRKKNPLNQSMEDPVANILKYGNNDQNEESDDELVGRSIHAEVDYHNPRIAQKQIKDQNLKNIQKNQRRQRLRSKNLMKYDEKSNDQQSVQVTQKYSNLTSLKSSALKNLDLLSKTMEKSKPQNPIIKPNIVNQRLCDAINKLRVENEEEKIEYRNFDLELIPQEQIDEANQFIQMQDLKAQNEAPCKNVTLGDGNFEQCAKIAQGQDYLFGLDMQTKNRYFPQIAVKNEHINNTMVVPQNMQMNLDPFLLGKESRNDKKLLDAFVQSEVPHAGAWFQRNSPPSKLFNSKVKTIQDMDAAGFRIPRSFKLTHAEKIPQLINQKLSEGLSNQQIQDTILDKRQKATEKYGNKSKVGMLISMNNPDPLKLRLALDKEKYVRKVQTKEVSDYNLAQHNHLSVGATSRRFGGPTLINEEDQVLNLGNTSSAHRTIYQGRSTENTYTDAERFRTTNQEEFAKKEFQDFSSVRKFYKRKTQFQQWSNALYNHGVYFNPPVNGI